MNKIAFVCLGNICRSPMAEFVMKDLVEKAYLDHEYIISSMGTSTEELGNPVYRPVKKLLNEKGIDTGNKRARQVSKSDYSKYDHFYGMDENNVRNMIRLFDGDPENKVTLFLSHVGLDRGVADPWYTRDFKATYDDVLLGCRSILQKLHNEEDF